VKTLFNLVRCLECGHQMEADLYAARCSACGGGWIEARYDVSALPSDWPALVARRPANMWRYWELLPFPDDFQVVSMGEGWTPLSRAEGLERESGHGQQGGKIWIKDERQQPTGSFKDRQAACTVSSLKARGIDELVLSSTGNAAAAYAAYCARAGIKFWVFLPSNVPAEKVRELALYGAEVVKISGTYDQAKEIAADFATRRGIYRDQGAKGITGKESMKTIALEIAEQLGWQAPDWYIQAVSGGIGPLGVLKGFLELRQAGLVDRVPKLGIVQVEGCSPMAQAWQRGLDKAEPVVPNTLVIVLSTGKPGLAYEILKQASDQYGGAMVAVSDGDAFRAMRRVARTEGFSMEPAASVAFAGLDKLLDEGHIQPGECVVVNCSGHTFSAEKHALEDHYMFQMDVDTPLAARPSDGIQDLAKEDLAVALDQLEEQITTIVVIDDNTNDSRLIRRLLQRYKQYRVFEAHSGLDGIDLVRQRRPDLVVLDLTLPRMDGFAILDELKADERTREIPVIIVSAKTLTADEWKHARLYTESVWQKGNFSARQLVDHVVRLLGDDV
jgi:threonine synthase